MAINR